MTGRPGPPRWLRRRRAERVVGARQNAPPTRKGRGRPVSDLEVLREPARGVHAGYPIEVAEDPTEPLSCGTQSHLFDDRRGSCRCGARTRP